MSSLKEAFQDNAPYKLFFASIAFSSLGYGVYKGVFDNFLAETVAMSEFDRGVTEFFRELPGLMLVFIFLLSFTLCLSRRFFLPAPVYTKRERGMAAQRKRRPCLRPSYSNRWIY